MSRLAWLVWYVFSFLPNRILSPRLEYHEERERFLRMYESVPDECLPTDPHYAWIHEHLKEANQ